MIITGVLGLFLDKQKLLALIMTLVGGAWGVFIGAQIAQDILRSC